jgi:peptidoglycan/xylan/chitin deacetylase (PgdA/CDA1 family)
VTFDDGYLENLEVVSPILVDLNIPATFFVNTDRLDEEHECWWDVLERVLMSNDELPPVLDLFGDGRWVRPTATADERLIAHRGVAELVYASTAAYRSGVIDRLVAWSGQHFAPRRSHRPMTREEVVELAAQPGHTIGAHTVNHLCLALQPVSIQLREIVDCKAELEHLLKRQITSLAYPYGDLAGHSVTAARDSGMATAVTVEGRLLRSGAHRLMVPRLEIKQCGVADFARLLDAAFAEARPAATAFE